jgi:hypothetical protein
MTFANSMLDTTAKNRAQALTNRAEELLEALPDHLLKTLGRLHDQPSDVVDVVLSTLRYGSRTALAGAKVIDGLTSDAEKGEQVTLTELGHALIAVCARDHGPDSDDEQRAQGALDSARQAWVNQNAPDARPAQANTEHSVARCR